MDMVDILGFFFTLSMMQIGQASIVFIMYAYADLHTAILERDIIANTDYNGRGSARLWSYILPRSKNSVP